MRFLVFGAGAVGSAFGGFLRKAGNPVTLFGRSAALAPIREHGLRISGIWGDHRVHGFDLCSDPALLAPGFDVILFSVKSYDTRGAARLLKPLLTPDTLVISLQNGVGNVEMLREVTGHGPILAGRVIFGSALPAPGHVTITVYTEPVMIGFPAAVSGQIPPALQKKAEDAASIIAASDIPCGYTREIEKFLWAKMIYNCALNPLGAIHRVPYGALMDNPGWRTLMDGVVREIFDVTRARGIPLFWNRPEEFLAIFYSKLIPDTRHHRSSMLQDLERGRKTEIASLNGIICAYARESGLSAPMNCGLVDQIRALEPRGPQG